MQLFRFFPYSRIEISRIVSFRSLPKKNNTKKQHKKTTQKNNTKKQQKVKQLTEKHQH